VFNHRHWDEQANIAKVGGVDLTRPV